VVFDLSPSKFLKILENLMYGWRIVIKTSVLTSPVYIGDLRPGSLRRLEPVILLAIMHATKKYFVIRKAIINLGGASPPRMC
jgi:hypothetical protein